MADIVQKDHPVLRKKALSVAIPDIQTSKIQKVLKDMKEALKTQSDGIAIAAPQIGEGLRIFVVSGTVYAIMKSSEKDSSRLERRGLPDEIYINPEIIKTSKRRKKMEEGCLSVRWLYGKVSRAEKVTIRAWNEKGEEFTRGGSGLLAQIFQHEIDHLDGTLFIDKAEDIEEIPPEKQKRG